MYAALSRPIWAAHSEINLPFRHSRKRPKTKFARSIAEPGRAAESRPSSPTPSPLMRRFLSSLNAFWTWSAELDERRDRRIADLIWNSSQANGRFLDAAWPNLPASQTSLGIQVCEIHMNERPVPTIG